MAKLWLVFLLLLFTGLVVAQEHGDGTSQADHDETPHDEASMHGDTSANLTDYTADHHFTLKAELVDGLMVYTGVGGDIDGLQNPTLEVEQGAVVETTLTNASVLEHDLILSELGAHAEHVPAEGDTKVFAFEADQVGEFSYFCSVSGHKETGMLGTFKISATE